MKRHCLLCGRERHDIHDGDHCRPCRLGLKLQYLLDANWRLRALRWFTTHPTVRA